MIPFIYNKKVPAEVARLVARLTARGQGLRACDVGPEVVGVLHICCFFCLARGARHPELLTHVLLECGTYREVRATPAAQRVLGRGLDAICSVQRETWGWGGLRVVRLVRIDFWACRLVAAGAGAQGASGLLAAQAEASWPAGGTQRGVRRSSRYRPPSQLPTWASGAPCPPPPGVQVAFESPERAAGRG